MQKEENKFCDSAIFEGMVSIRAVLTAARDGINDRKITRVFYAKERLKKIGKEVAYLRHEGERSGFTVEETDMEALSAMTLGTSHGGLVAECTHRSISPLRAEALPEKGFFVMLEGIEDPYNFGYALRSFYALGVDGVVLPERNWMSAAGVVARASAGASEQFTMYTASSEEAAAAFRARGYKVVCADADTDTALEQATLSYPIFLIIGGEKRGISAALKKLADVTVRISYGRPFQGALSAASAATILAYEITRQNR